MSYPVAVIQLILACKAVVGCVYLAYILTFVLHDLCVVCVSTYVINTIILACSFIKFKAIQNLETVKKQKNDSKKAS